MIDFRYEKAHSNATSHEFILQVIWSKSEGIAYVGIVLNMI